MIPATVKESTDRKPISLAPSPYDMVKSFPFATYVEDCDESYILFGAGWNVEMRLNLITLNGLHW